MPFNFLLLSGETVVKRPDETRVRNSSLDAQRDFVISVKVASSVR